MRQSIVQAALSAQQLIADFIAKWGPDGASFGLKGEQGAQQHFIDFDTISRDLRAGGFAAAPTIGTVAARSRAVSARSPAIALCQGTPLRGEIEARGASRLGEATDIAEQALARRFGPGPVDGKIQAHVVMVEC